MELSGPESHDRDRREGIGTSTRQQWFWIFFAHLYHPHFHVEHYTFLLFLHSLTSPLRIHNRLLTFPPGSPWFCQRGYGIPVKPAESSSIPVSTILRAS